MTLPTLTTTRFTPEPGLRLCVQAPDSHVARIIEDI